MSKLKQTQVEILLKLFREAKGQAGYFILLEENPALEELLRAKLLEIEFDETGNYAALTDEGAALAAELHREQSTIHTQISFDTSDPEQARLVQQLAKLANSEIGALLGHLFALHEAIAQGDIDALLSAYPESRATIHQMIRAGVESQMMAQEQHRINHLLGEISELKTMLTKQAQQQQQPVLRPIPLVEEEEDEDSAPIPAPQPVSLRPVLPVVPQGQPKQLSVPQFALPHDEEESEALFVVKKDEDAGKRASENFIQSLNRLQKS